MVIEMTKKIIVSIFVVGYLLATSMASVNASVHNEEEQNIEMKKTILIGEPFDGYILYTPLFGRITYLLNKDNSVVHMRVSSHPALDAYLLENGNLIRPSFMNLALPNLRFPIWGQIGRIEMFNKNGIRIWNFEYLDDQYSLHHDIEPLPNGNVLMTVWEKKTRDDAIAAGRNPSRTSSRGWCPDYIIEVKPTGLTTGDIVWEWHLCDHLIQDYDSTKDNYGAVEDHPELIDINLYHNSMDWLHLNSIDYNEEFNQILLSIRNLDEIWVIDHSTTTEEAAGHSGGNSGKGGDILYRWGNPQNYRAGNADDRKLFGQHDVRWIEEGCPGEGHITIINNGYGRPGEYYSSVEEIVPPVDENGNYYLEFGSAYGPEEPTWSINSSDECNFETNVYSGAQRLPNENTLICAGLSGAFYLVTPDKKLVWEKHETHDIFKMNFYPSDYPGLNSLSIEMENEQSNQQQQTQGQQYQNQEGSQLLQKVLQRFLNL